MQANSNCFQTTSSNNMIRPSIQTHASSTNNSINMFMRFPWQLKNSKTAGKTQYASNKTRPKNKSKASGDGSMQLKQTTAWCSRCFKTAARLCQQWYHVIDQTSPGTTATINKHGHGTLSS
jgi:hypothetical protein